MAALTRVYHPRLPSWHDVADVESWERAGWLTEKPEADGNPVEPAEHDDADVAEPADPAMSDEPSED